MPALNEVSGSTWIQWLQGSAVIGAVLVTAVLTWVVRDLWERVDFLWACGADKDDLEAINAGIDNVCERVGMLEMAVSQTRHKVDKHEEMLAHMQRMRDAKAAKKAKQVA